MNEISELKFEVDYKPSEIKILNEDKLAELVNTTAKTYSSITYTEDNLNEAKTARADLNKVAKKIDDERKKVKNQFSEPLTAFEKKMNGYKKQIKDVSDSINESLNEYEQQQRQERGKKINAYLEEEAKSFGLEVAEIAFNSSWLNGGSFTPKGALTKGTKESICLAVQDVAKEKQRVSEEKEAVKNFADLAGFDPAPWVVMVDQGQSSNEIIAAIKTQKEVKEKQEQARKAAEEQAKQRKAEQERLAKEQAEREQAAFEERQKRDEELAQQAEEESQQEPVTVEKEEHQAEDDPILEYTLKITANKSALFALNQYMKDNDIQFEKVEG